MARCYTRAMFRFAGSIFFLFPALAVAQIHPHFGVEIGTPLTDTFTSGGFSSFAGNAMTVNETQAHTRRLQIGPSFGIEFAHGFGIEFDALYQRESYDSYAAFGPPLSYTFTQAAANRWQFPLLMQYARKIWKIRAFAEAGPSFLHVSGPRFTSTSNISSDGTVGVTPVTTTSSSSGLGTTSAGLTAGGGIDVLWWRFHLRPEFRYSRWFSPVAGPGSGISSAVFFFPATGFLSGNAVTGPFFHANQNEASFLLGITF